MKKKLLLLIGFVLIAGTALADAGVIESLTAHTDGDVISVDWRSGVESGVKSYIVERCEVNGSTFADVGTITASGNYSSYHFRDTRISSTLANGQSSNHIASSDLYKYRIQMVYDNAVSYSQTIFVSRPASGVRRTWGMIKEMFR